MSATPFSGSPDDAVSTAGLGRPSPTGLVAAAIVSPVIVAAVIVSPVMVAPVLGQKAALALCSSPQCGQGNSATGTPFRREAGAYSKGGVACYNVVVRLEGDQRG